MSEIKEDIGLGTADYSRSLPFVQYHQIHIDKTTWVSVTSFSVSSSRKSISIWNQ